MKQGNIALYYMILLCTVIISCKSKSVEHISEVANSEIDKTMVNTNYKELALGAIHDVIDADNDSQMSEYFSPQLILHKDAKIFNMQELAKMVASNKHKGINREVGRVIGEGNKVGVHSRRTVNGTSYIMADFFKFEQGKISDYWIFVQREISASPQSVRKIDMLAGASNAVLVSNTEQIQNNKSIAQLYMTDVLDKGNIDMIDKLLGDSFTPHSSTFPDGKRKLTKMLSKMNRLPNKIKNVIAEGDYVWLHTNYPTYNLEVVNIFRIRDNRIVEHWDVLNDSTMVISSST